jgi:hypothetical protein
MLRGRFACVAIVDLQRRINATKKQFSVPLNHLGNAKALDNVGTDSDHIHAVQASQSATAFQVFVICLPTLKHGN